MICWSLVKNPDLLRPSGTGFLSGGAAVRFYAPHVWNKLPGHFGSAPTLESGLNCFLFAFWLIQFGSIIYFRSCTKNVFFFTFKTFLSSLIWHPNMWNSNFHMLILPIWCCLSILVVPFSCCFIASFFQNKYLTELNSSFSNRNMGVVDELTVLLLQGPDIWGLKEDNITLLFKMFTIYNIITDSCKYVT